MSGVVLFFRALILREIVFDDPRALPAVAGVLRHLSAFPCEGLTPGTGSQSTFTAVFCHPGGLLTASDGLAHNLQDGHFCFQFLQMQVDSQRL